MNFKSKSKFVWSNYFNSQQAQENNKIFEIMIHPTQPELFKSVISKFKGAMQSSKNLEKSNISKNDRWSDSPSKQFISNRSNR